MFKNVVKNVDISSLRAPCQNDPYKIKNTYSTKTEHQDATDIHKKTLFEFHKNHCP